jgi:hypothetical protein
MLLLGAPCVILNLLRPAEGYAQPARLHDPSSWPHSPLRHSPFCFHHGALREGASVGDVGFVGPANGGVGEAPAEGGDSGFCFRYLIQYKPVPGMLNEMYRCPPGETPYRRPGIPQLHPIPRLDSVHRNGPRPNTLRNRHTSNPLTPPSNQRTPASRISKTEFPHRA